MTEKEGVLLVSPSGRWVIYRRGHPMVKVGSGGLFRIGVDGEL